MSKITRRDFIKTAAATAAVKLIPEWLIPSSSGQTRMNSSINDHYTGRANLESRLKTIGVLEQLGEIDKKIEEAKISDDNPYHQLYHNTLNAIIKKSGTILSNYDFQTTLNGLQTYIRILRFKGSGGEYIVIQKYDLTQQALDNKKEPSSMSVTQYICQVVTTRLFDLWEASSINLNISLEEIEKPPILDQIRKSLEEDNTILSLEYLEKNYAKSWVKRSIKKDTFRDMAEKMLEAYIAQAWQEHLVSASNQQRIILPQNKVYTGNLVSEYEVGPLPPNYLVNSSNKIESPTVIWMTGDELHIRVYEKSEKTNESGQVGENLSILHMPESAFIEYVATIRDFRVDSLRTGHFGRVIQIGNNRQRVFTPCYDNIERGHKFEEIEKKLREVLNNYNLILARLGKNIHTT